MSAAPAARHARLAQPARCGIDASPVTRGRISAPAAGCSPDGEGESRDLGGEARPVVAIRGAERSAERPPEHVQGAGRIAAGAVEGRPPQREIGVVERRFVAEALDPPSSAIGREGRHRAKRARQRLAERAGVGMGSQDAERRVPFPGRGQPRGERLRPASHSGGVLVSPEPLAEDVAHDRAASAPDAEGREIGGDGARAIAEQSAERGRLFQEARFQDRLAALRRQPLERGLDPRRQRLLLDEPDPVGGGQSAAQHAGDRQEAGRFGVHERLEALPVEAEHVARRLRADRGRARLARQQRHLAEEVPGAEPVDPSGGAAGRIVHVDAQPSGGEDEEAVAGLALAADGVAFLEDEGIEVGGELGEGDPIDLREERDPGEGVLQAGPARLARKVESSSSRPGIRPREAVDENGRSGAERVVLADHPRLEPRRRGRPGSGRSAGTRDGRARRTRPRARGR